VELNRLTIDKAWRVNDREALLSGYDKASSLLSPDLLMIQEFLPGGGESQFSYVALCDDGRPVASLTAKRLRQFPMDFGRFSTFVETVEEPAVDAAAMRLLSALRYTGLVEVEFKWDARDGHYKLLDINTRVWGWHTLCARAGVDFPYLLWLQTRGECIPEVRARVGTRWVRMGADFSTALLEMARGQLPFRSYLNSIRGGLEWAIFAADDPMPFIGQMPGLMFMLGKRAFERKRTTRVSA
jgi:D-aspartate ligase